MSFAAFCLSYVRGRTGMLQSLGKASYVDASICYVLINRYVRASLW